MQRGTSVTHPSRDLPEAYRDVLARAEVLSVQAERELGQRLVEARRDRWRVLLACPSALAFARARPAIAETSLAPDLDHQIEALLDADPDGEEAEAVARHLAATASELPSRNRKRADETLAELAAVQIRLDAAQRAFVESNLRLVAMVANRFSRRGMPLGDLIQEGNIGLVRAVQRFDPRRGFRFSTYATWWIRHCISRCIADHARTVRVPVHVGDVARRLHKVRAEAKSDPQLDGRDLPLDELAKRADVSIEKARLTEMLQQRIAPLDAKAGPEGRSLQEILEDETLGDPDEQLTRDELSARALGAMRGLSDMEIEILEHRFGLHGREELTLQTLAGRYDLSRERIRQIQNKALAKLKHTLS